MVKTEKIIKILEEIPEEAALIYPEYWIDSEESTKWREEAIIALREAIEILKNKEEI